MRTPKARASIRRLSFCTVQLFVALVLWLPGARAQSDSYEFPETGKTVREPFLHYWSSHGGLAQQGYPISDEIQERSDTDGKVYTVQYFERAVFEHHPENQPPFNVLLSLLGNHEYERRYPTGAPNRKASTDNPRKFSVTGKTIGGPFRAYWEQNGALAQHGYPISDQFQERSDLDGKSYTVQYFERAVFELHPENGPPFNVLLSQLGTFQFRRNYATERAAEVAARLTLRGHSDWVMSAAFSPGAETIATAGAEGTVKLWDAASGRERLTVRPGGRVVSVAYSPDGKRIVTASYDDDRAKVWDSTSGAQLATLCCHEGGGYVTGAVYSPDGRLIASAEHSSNGGVKVWDAATGQQRRNLTSIGDAFYSPAWSADGTKVAAGSEGSEVVVWDAASGRVLLSLQNHQGSSAQRDTGGVHSVAFSPDGKRLLTGAEDGVARVWNLADGKPLLAISHPLSEQREPRSSALVSSFARVNNGGIQSAEAFAARGWAMPLLHTRWALTATYSPDGRSILTAGSDGTARLWDALNGQPLAALRGHQNWLFSAAFSQDGGRVVTTSADRTAKVWDLQP